MGLFSNRKKKQEEKKAQIREMGLLAFPEMKKLVDCISKNGFYEATDEGKQKAQEWFSMEEKLYGPLSETNRICYWDALVMGHQPYVLATTYAYVVGEIMPHTAYGQRMNSIPNPQDIVKTFDLFYPDYSKYVQSRQKFKDWAFVIVNTCLLIFDAVLNEGEYEDEDDLYEDEQPYDFKLTEEQRRYYDEPF